MEIVHFQVCGKHLIGLAVQLMLPNIFIALEKCIHFCYAHSFVFTFL